MRSRVDSDKIPDGVRGTITAASRRAIPADANFRQAAGQFAAEGDDTWGHGPGWHPPADTDFQLGTPHVHLVGGPGQPDAPPETAETETEGPETAETGAGETDNPLHVSPRQFSSLTPQQVGSIIDRHMDAYGRPGASQEERQHALNQALEAAYLYQLSTSGLWSGAGNGSGFDRISARLGAAGASADSPDRTALTTAQSRAQEVFASGAALQVRHLNSEGINLGSRLYELQAGLANPATREDDIREAASYYPLSEQRGADWLTGLAMRVVIEHAGYGSEYRTAQDEVNREVQEQQRRWVTAFNDASIAERAEMYGPRLVTDMAMGFLTARLMRSRTILWAPMRGAEFRRASVVLPETPFPTRTRPTGRVGIPFGTPEALEGSALTRTDLRLQNESLFGAARARFRVILDPTENRVNGRPVLTPEDLERQGLRRRARPDALIEGRVFDVYSPWADSAENIAKVIFDKVESGQANRILLNLSRSRVRLQDLRAALRADLQRRGANLREVLVRDRRGRFISLFPFTAH
jgi:hypothetical protein